MSEIFSLTAYFAERQRSGDRFLADAMLDLFEREIAADDPPQVTEAARTYLAERRQGMERLATRQYSAAADVTITSARAKLDQVCGVS